MDLIRCHRLGFSSGGAGFFSLGVLAKKRPADTGAWQRSGGCSGRRTRDGRRHARMVERSIVAEGRPKLEGVGCGARVWRAATRASALGGTHGIPLGGASGGPAVQRAGHQPHPRPAALVRPDARACLRRVRRGLARRARAARGGGRRAGGAAVARHGGAHAGGGALVHRLLAAPAAGPRHLPRVRTPPHPPGAAGCRTSACRGPSSSGACSAASSSEDRRRECRSTCRTPTSSSTRPARDGWPAARKRARTPRVPQGGRGARAPQRRSYTAY